MISCSELYRSTKVCIGCICTYLRRLLISSLAVPRFPVSPGSDILGLWRIWGFPEPLSASDWNLYTRRNTESYEQKMSLSSLNLTLYLFIFDINLKIVNIWLVLLSILQLISYPEIVSLSALIVCNAMNWPAGAAISCFHKRHHRRMLYTFGQYIVNVQWNTTSDRFLTLFTSLIRFC